MQYRLVPSYTLLLLLMLLLLLPAAAARNRAAAASAARPRRPCAVTFISGTAGRRPPANGSRPDGAGACHILRCAAAMFFLACLLVDAF